MNLSQLSPIVEKKKRRAGQGHGSGRVKTSGRGTKGQKARRNIPMRFEGGALPLVKRLPFLRGKSKNKVIFGKPEIVKLESLAVFSKNATVDVKSLVAAKLVDEKGAKKYGVKILGDGALSVSLTVKVAVTSSAKKKIEKAGGSVAQ